MAYQIIISPIHYLVWLTTLTLFHDCWAMPFHENIVQGFIYAIIWQAMANKTAEQAIGLWPSFILQWMSSAGFSTKGRLLVKSNIICPSDKLSWQPGCPVLNINIQGKSLLQPRKWLFGQPARKLSVDPSICLKKGNILYFICWSYWSCWT